MTGVMGTGRRELNGALCFFVLCVMSRKTVSWIRLKRITIRQSSCRCTDESSRRLPPPQPHDEVSLLFKPSPSSPSHHAYMSSSSRRHPPTSATSWWSITALRTFTIFTWSPRLYVIFIVGHCCGCIMPVSFLLLAVVVTATYMDRDSENFIHSVIQWTASSCCLWGLA